MPVALATLSLSVFRGAASKRPETATTLEKVIGVIRGNEAMRAKVVRLRGVLADGDEERYDEQKKHLLAATFSGVFNARKLDGLESHSGLYVYDVDVGTTAENLSKVRRKVVEAAGPHLALLYVSPSGTGLKLVLHGPKAKDHAQHLSTWQAGARLLSSVSQHLPPGQNDVTRLSFLSHDPDCVANDEAEPFPLTAGADKRGVAREELEEDDPLAGVTAVEDEDEKINQLLDQASARVDGITLEVAKELLSHLDPFVTREVWMLVVMAVKTQWAGTPEESEAEELARSWSNGEVGGPWKSANNYTEKGFNQVWRSSKATRKAGHVATMHGVMKKARDAGWVPTDKNWKAALLRTEDGSMKVVSENLILVLRNHVAFKGRLRYNIHSSMMDIKLGEKWDVVSDVSLTRVQAKLEVAFGQPLPRQRVVECMDVVARDYEIHPIRDYLSALEWDGVKRLEDVFIKGFNAADVEAHRLFARKFMISAIARAMVPGCKVDTVPVLVGGQGHRKSSGWRALCGDDWFGEGHLDFQDPKACVEKLLGKWIYEMSEMTSLHRATREAVKGFVSGQTDTVRFAYDKHARNVQRGFVLVGTGNEDKFLSDPTGNRRFWPVRLRENGDELMLVKRSLECAKWARANRDQLWAEAYAAWQGGEQWWLTPEQEIKIAKPIQEQARVEHEWEDPVNDLIDGVEEGGTAWNEDIGNAMIAAGCMPPKPWVWQVVRAWMASKGWRPVVLRRDGKRAKGFVKN